MIKIRSHIRYCYLSYTNISFVWDNHENTFIQRTNNRMPLLSACVCYYLRRRSYNFPRSHVARSRISLYRRVSGARQRNGERKSVTAREATWGAAVVFCRSNFVQPNRYLTSTVSIFTLIHGVENLFAGIHNGLILIYLVFQNEWTNYLKLLAGFYSDKNVDNFKNYKKILYWTK